MSNDVVVIPDSINELLFNIHHLLLNSNDILKNNINRFIFKPGDRVPYTMSYTENNTHMQIPWIGIDFTINMLLRLRYNMLDSNSLEHFKCNVMLHKIYGYSGKNYIDTLIQYGPLDLEIDDIINNLISNDYNVSNEDILKISNTINTIFNKYIYYHIDRQPMNLFIIERSGYNINLINKGEIHSIRYKELLDYS